MATEQTITISGTPTVVSGVTVPYVNTSDLEIYIGKGKIESIEVTNAGAGYTNITHTPEFEADSNNTVNAKLLGFSGGGGTAPTNIRATVSNGQIDSKFWTDAHGTEFTGSGGSDYTTAPNVDFSLLTGGTGAQLTAKIYAKKELTTDYTLSGTSGNTTITFTSALADEDKVLIKRVTGVSTAANTFAAGSAITAEALNKSFDQIRYKVEELPTITNTAVTDGRKDDIEVSGSNWTIINDAVTSAKIADDQINSEHYVADSIDTEHYAPNSVDTAALGPDCVTGAQIADDQINSEHYIADSIDTEHYAPLSVDAAALAANAVTTAKILNDNVTAPKIDLSIVQGDLIYGTGTDTWNRLAKGTAGQQLRINNGATAPEWATPNVQCNVYVKQYTIDSTGINSQNAAEESSNDLTVKTYYDTPITTTIIPQIGTSLMLLNAVVSFEASQHDYHVNWRIKAEVLNNAETPVVQSTSYITNNYNGSAIHNSSDGSLGYVNKGANLNTGIEDNRTPILISGNTSYSSESDDTISNATINNLLHDPGTVVSSDPTNNKVRYTVQVTMKTAGVVYINRTNDDHNDSDSERGVSWFTVQETMGSITVDV